MSRDGFKIVKMGSSTDFLQLLKKKINTCSYHTHMHKIFNDTVVRGFVTMVYRKSQAAFNTGSATSSADRSFLLFCGKGV